MSRAPSSLTEWLRGRSDAQLIDLLRHRPDLALPAPGDLGTLASRVSVRTSVQRAVDTLDAFRLSVLEARVLAGPFGEPLASDWLQRWLSDVSHTELHAALDGLRDLALVWGDDDALRLVSGVVEAIGPYPAGLGRPGRVLQSESPAPDVIKARLDGLDTAEREILDRLAAGPPIGVVRDAMFRGSPQTPVQVLIGLGLLVPVDPQTVELPREVGLVLRGEHALGPVPSEPPPIPTLERDIDRAGTTAAFDAIRLVEALAEEWTHTPPPTLRSGGLGVRELRRTAKALGVDEPVTALVIETAYAAGLIDSTPGITPIFAPTPEYDDWRRRDAAHRWVPLGAAWLAMTREPSLVGERDDRDRVITALGPDASRGTIPALRRTVLTALTELPPGQAPTTREAVLERLAWVSPRRARAQRRAIEAILAEADLLGITAAGGLTGYGRALLAGSSAAAETALALALPEPVDEFLVQPDLTVVVPGPPTAELARELGFAADLESSGGASVYRISEATIRRALDAGRTGTDLSLFFAQRSRTPVPQALSYMIDDLARRHGQLRVGTASAYLRCDDEDLLSRAVADRAVAVLNLRRLAPTVAVTSVTVNRMLDVLRDAGYAPAAEAADGAVLTLTSEALRAPGRPRSPTRDHQPGPDADTRLAGIVERMRAGESLRELTRRVMPTVSQQIPGVTSAATLGVLRDAIRGSRQIWISYVDNSGSASQQQILPVSLAGGVLRGHPVGSERLLAFPVHRITAVSVLDQ